MAEDPNHPWGSGATRYHWRRDVSLIVHKVLNRWPSVTANTYVCHPWCGWADQSVDFWGIAGRGDPLVGERAEEIRRYLMSSQDCPTSVTLSSITHCGPAGAGTVGGGGTTTAGTSGTST